jgi:carotenoid cleavage dioxygenase-like enzyme
MIAYRLIGLVGLAQGHFDTRLAHTWVEDANDEITDAKITFEGTVPEYVRGTFVQGGPARFTLPHSKVTHLFDGFGKHCILRFQSDGSVLYSSTFLKGSYYNASMKAGTFAHSLLMGDTVPPSRGTIDLLAGHNDNNYIKPHRIGSSDQFLSDTVVSACATDDWSRYDHSFKDAIMLYTPGTVWKGDAHIAGHMCMTATMAHGHQDPVTGVFTAVMGCTSPMRPLLKSYHVVFSIHPSDPSKRNLVAKVPLENGRDISYMHAMGYTSNHVVIVAQPMHMDMMKAMKGHVLQDSLYVGNGTLFTVVNRHDGTYKNYPLFEGFFFGHITNTWEEEGDIYLDLT